jgi:1,4-alpha-glucan branching enzyme
MSTPRTKKLITDLNRLYKAEPALFEKQFSPDGFEWINYSDHQMQLFRLYENKVKG